MGLLVVIVLLLVVMPTLLYLMARSVTAFTAKKPEWIGFPTSRDAVERKPRIEPRESTGP